MRYNFPMLKHQIVAGLVKVAYENSSQEFAQWMWKYHVPVVAEKTEQLAQRFEANADIAVAGAWLHDFGDAFMHRFDDAHDETSFREGEEVLQQSGYTPAEIEQVMKQVIEPHSCRDGNLPVTLEGKVMATGDALAHLTTDFYLQFCWQHLPEGKNYHEFLDWVSEKLDRDFNHKIFFAEVQQETRQRYEALIEVFSYT
jgi:hypothetical protein